LRNRRGVARVSDDAVGRRRRSDEAPHAASTSTRAPRGKRANRLDGRLDRGLRRSRAMRLAHLAIAGLLVGGTACLGRYTPPGGSNSGQQQSPAPSPPPHSPAPADGGSGTPTPPPSPPPSPPPAPPSSTADGGTPAPTPAPGASPNCQLLGDCCDLLPTQDAQTCNAGIANLTDDTCLQILTGLQQQGVCP
jgi:cell division septation protein DedD